jgi:hypothetical protein
MAADPFYKRCCITGKTNEKIDWHHNFEYQGRQCNEKWCILPLSKSVHDDIVYHKDRCDWVMLNRATLFELIAKSKAINMVSERIRLNEKYGPYREDWYNKKHK